MTEFAISERQFAALPFDEALHLTLHTRICAELMPAIAGRRRTREGQVGEQRCWRIWAEGQLSGIPPESPALPLAKMMQIRRQLTSNMQHPIASLLLPEYRRRVLGLLLLRPEESLHGREIARRTGLPAGTVTRELGKLTHAGLLRRDKRGNQQIYCADTTSPVFSELASILRKTSGMADVLIQALAPLAPRIRTAFVYGSVAQGRQSAGSDIDLLVIGDVGFKEIVEVTHSAQTTLAREINPKVFGVMEFRSNTKAGPFLRDVLGKPKIFLIGSEHDLEELAGHQP